MSTNTLETGIGFYCMSSPYMRPIPLNRIYEEAAREAQLAEDLGFDVFWTAEHHHAYDGYCPSSLPAISFMAERTKSIKFGTGVYVLPHHGTERTRQGISVIQSIAPNRLYLGVGVGNWGDEYAAAGRSLKDRGPMIEEGLRDLLADGGKDLGGTEIWYGATSPVALKRAGRYGASLLLTPTNVEGYQMQRAIWEGALVPREGQKPRAICFFDVYVDDDADQRQVMGRLLLEMWRGYALNWIDNPRDMGLDLDRSDILHEQQAIRDELASRVSQGYVNGTASEVVDRLAPLVEAGIDGFAFRIHYNGVVGPVMERCIERLASDVIPQLKAIRS